MATRSSTRASARSRPSCTDAAARRTSQRGRVPGGSRPRWHFAARLRVSHWHPAAICDRGQGREPIGMAFDYDLFVIGGGSGGVRAARVAAQGGAKVALAEESRYGGTCVIRGCVPKKLMVFASSYSGLPDEASAYGWDMSLGDFRWDSFSTRMRTELDRLEGVYRNMLKGSGVETFDARAVLKDAHTVELSTGETKTAKHILIATGGHPVRPELSCAQLGIVSDDIFDLETLPKSIL